MAVENAYRFSKTVVLGNEFLQATGNKFAYVSQRPFKGKTDEKTGDFILPPGVNLVLQITEDHTEPIIDKSTNMPKDNMVMNNFTATIIGANYPLNLKKGQLVSLKDFIQDYSYEINGDLLLRFRGVELVKKASNDNN